MAPEKAGRGKEETMTSSLREFFDATGLADCECEKMSVSCPTNWRHTPHIGKTVWVTFKNDDTEYPYVVWSDNNIIEHTHWRKICAVVRGWWKRLWQR